MAAYASDGGFHAQACYHCSQAVEKALKALLLALDQEPEPTHSIERLFCALESFGIATTPLRQLPLKALQRMITASRYPDGDEAPWHGPWWGLADQQLADLVQPEST